MVIRLRVSGGVNHVRVVADVFHDVDFAVVRPVTGTVVPLRWQHPDGGPGAASGRELYSHFEPAISPVAFAFRHETRRTVRLGFAPVTPRFDNQHTVFDAGIF